MVIEVSYSNKIDFKVFFIGAILACLMHLIAIPLIDLIPKRAVEEEIEPKIILELIKKVDTIKPIPEQKIIKPRINNNIQKEQIIKEISPLPKIEKAQKLDKKYISPTPHSINQTIKNKITIPVKPKNNNLNKKFISPVIPIKPNIIIEKILKPLVHKQTNLKSEPKITSPTKQTFFLENIPIIQKYLPVIPKKEQVIEEENMIDSDTVSQYNELIRSKIKKDAYAYYQQRLRVKGEEGTVHIIFTLSKSGNLESIEIGPQTQASERLINATKAAVEKNSPYKLNKILEQKHEFSVLIIYKIK